MKKLIYAFIASFMLMACESDFTELEILDELTDQTFYASPTHFELAANLLYDGMHGWGAADEFKDYGSDLVSIPQLYTQGNVVAPESDELWNEGYDDLRDINMLIESAAEYTGDPVEIAASVGTAHFFRAYEYFTLMRRFGGVPLITTVISPTSPPELFKTPRSSRYEVLSLILSDLDEAIANCPPSVGDADLGKITSMAAKAYKSKVLLYAATWDRYVGTATDGDGVNAGAGSAKPAEYPTVEAMLTEAVALAKEVMDDGGYQLWDYKFDEINSTFYLHQLEDAGSNPLGLDKSTNREFIIQNVYDFDLRPGDENFARFESRMAPNRKSMDMFLCTDGLPIDKSPLFQGYHTMWDELQNRDFRMIGYFYNVPEGGSPLLNVGPSDSGAGIGIRNRKFKSWNGYRPNTRHAQNYSILRLAEVYLTYAEALYELNGSISDAQLDESINLTRARAGIAPLTNSLATTHGLDILEEIRRERALELYCENTRIHDVKRWGIADEVFQEEVYGAVIEGTIYEGNDDLYIPTIYPFGEKTITVGTGEQRRVIVRDGASNRNFTMTHYLAPIPISQISLTGILQNPGY
ncbi:RagB/SusD family nutrient uptake outer membrane protein [Marinoscillum furvescens]|uniref:Putative outer membrane starch-binding protein n=1 Tax=Marinoscillum furvescens DSM 4134 TaxID=1122208 RepID=A0A3D9L0U7_MARFU|nr:RagB/SusD family nutrient uptake outer membrane protein [Marinoscillum furvescens]RED94666.1 putative outer membrane starch-binding protein [Marinoscillum furvescens DSM 4134]